MERVYFGSTRLLSGLLVVLGIVLIGLAVAGGGGPTALGVLVGVGMTLAGAARLWLLRGVRDGQR